jgi:predicted GNAT family N-acyltransferase
MPFQKVEGFDAEMRLRMTQVFDMACERLGFDPDHLERAKLARVIIEFASRGEHDAGKLYSLAIEAIDQAGC